MLTLLPNHCVTAHSSVLFNSFPASDTSLCSAKVFLPLRNTIQVFFFCFHWLSFDSKENAPFLPKAFNYSCADHDCFHDLFRDVQWENICNVVGSATFFVWGFVLAFMYVSHIRIIESNLFAYFQAAYVPGIARINHFLRFYQHSKSTVSKC